MNPDHPDNDIRRLQNAATRSLTEANSIMDCAMVIEEIANGMRVCDDAQANELEDALLLLCKAHDMLHTIRNNMDEEFSDSDF